MNLIKVKDFFILIGFNFFKIKYFLKFLFFKKIFKNKNYFSGVETIQKISAQRVNFFKNIMHYLFKVNFKQPLLNLNDFFIFFPPAV